ncbi:MAG: hypothetical protein M1376_00605 [Planctomycetes bacterium]|nr:hypothetical protein [Planctomycetota bacterium]
MVGEPKPEHPLRPHRPPISRRQLLMQSIVAGVILVSGVGIGAGGSILALRGRILPRIRVMPIDPPGPEPNAIVGRWKGKYGLSDRQEQQAKDILTKQFTALREIRQKLFQAEQSEREKASVSLKKVFDPEQYAKWDQDMKRMEEWFERMRSRGPRGDHRGPPRGDRGPGRPKDPNDHRWDGPPRPPMEFGGRRGDWPPRGPMDPNNRRRGDRPPDRPPEPEIRPTDGNGPR